MKCNKYKFKQNNIEFLAYINDGEELSFPPFWEVELLAEDIDPGIKENSDYQIIHAPESWSARRTRDKILEDAHILSFFDLANAFFLTRTKELKKPRVVREAVIAKYCEVINLVKLKDNGTIIRSEVQGSE